MTIRELAKAAGVSAATVSRVLNADSYYSDRAAEAVRRAIAETHYNPARRRRRSKTTVETSEPLERRLRFGFFLIGFEPNIQNPAHMSLMRGVNQAAKELGLELEIDFLTGPDEVVQRVQKGEFDGLVLHGLLLNDAQSKALKGVPTMWLMSGSGRPRSGDQVMPDNDSIGRLAAEFLLNQGHRRVAYFGFDNAWFLDVRSTSFQRAIEEGGGEMTNMFKVPVPRGGAEPWPDKFAEARRFFKALAKQPVSPTGLFVAEDWITPAIYVAAAEAGVRIGTELSVISCNNDRARLEGLHPVPPTIDIHFDRIGYRGTQLLALRLKLGTFEDRVRISIEPTLVA